MTSELFSVAGRVALVTGGGGGLGARFAHVLAANGATVVVMGRRMLPLEKVVASITAEYGCKALAVAADLADRAAVEAAFDRIEKHFGVVEILVNSAGIQATQSCLEMTDEQFTSVLDVNVNGIFRAAQICAQRLVQAGKAGSIINIASILGEVARPEMANYCASKAAVIHMTKSMALDLVAKRVRVNCLAPGYFETDLTRWFLQSPEGKAAQARLPIGRFGNLEELDGPLLFLASGASKYVAGATLIVDAGHSCRVME
jgi:NAD(P)-dependent dehydrogenase (short-subunit alcohol dehydrogenase family)